MERRRRTVGEAEQGGKEGGKAGRDDACGKGGSETRRDAVCLGHLSELLRGAVAARHLRGAAEMQSCSLKVILLFFVSLKRLVLLYCFPIRLFSFL